MIDFNRLFTPGKIGNVTVKNRIVRSATYESVADEKGHVTEEMIDLYSDLAEGGTGLIITGFTTVDPEGMVGPKTTGLYDDSCLAGQRRLVDAVHEYEGVKIASQLAHCGRQILIPGIVPVAPSPITDKMINRMPRELSSKEVREIIDKFVGAGRRAYESGYDAVQIHAAHGYLLSSFLSPYSNKRSDEFGGDTKGRTKILLDICDGIHDEVGFQFPIIVKMQSQDGISEGLCVEEAKDIARLLVHAGYSAIEPSGGIYEGRLRNKSALPMKLIKSQEDEAYLLPTARELKPTMGNCPLILIGGMRDPVMADGILESKIADFISLSRPLICEPDLPNRWSEGDLSPVKCKSCNRCYFNMGREPLHCYNKK
ncbi:MAG: NADH:flavin oxidoreductase [Halobacteriota archaeon]|nr:NADH:flavin oxidoreductase [Halobacteriota archaeon]